MATQVHTYPSYVNNFSYGPKNPSHNLIKTCRKPKIVIKRTVLKPAEVKARDEAVKPAMEKSELVELVAVAKRSADAVALKNLPATHPDFSRSLDALGKLKDCGSSSLQTLCLDTKVMKCLEKLGLHPKFKIRAAATAILEECKKLSHKAGQPVGHQRADESKIVNIPKAYDIVKESIQKKVASTPRGNTQKRIADALFAVETEAEDESTKAQAKASDLKQIASSIEEMIHKKLAGNDSKSKAQCRSILFNLTDANNPDLRRRVALGEIKPEKLFEMSVKEMACRKRKLDNEDIRKNSEIQSEVGMKQEETTEISGCCRYYQMETRCAEEPMTTYFTCAVCDNQWKVTDKS